MSNPRPTLAKLEAKFGSPPTTRVRVIEGNVPMVRKIASIEGYLMPNSKKLFIRENFSGKEIKDRMGIVRAVEFVRERIYPANDQVLHDYYVTFEDGTTDCLSFTLVDPPEIGEFHCRYLCPFLAGDYECWGETYEQTAHFQSRAAAEQEAMRGSSHAGLHVDGRN